MKLFYILVTLLVFAACNTNENTKSTSLVSIPSENEVGADNLPDTIAPVVAPFNTIDFKKPSFPHDTVVVSLSTEKINTPFIQNAIDALSEKGGGVIVIPEGEWLTGRIQLKDNINLHLAKGATLQFSGEIADFLPVVFTRVEGIEVMSLGACIYANKASNIAVTGNGQLIGPGEGSIRSNILTSQVIDDVIDPETPVEERIVDGKQQPWIFPPMFISPINCEQVYIEGISLRNTAFWNIVPVYCNIVIIRGVRVNSVGVPRGDGIDVESSTNVLIEYSTLSCGDDCFTMKAGRGADGVRVDKATENVVVRYCLAREGHGGITVGSETAGTIRNLYVHDCVFIDVGVGIRFKTRRPRGGGGENLTYERLRLNLRYTAIKWDMLGSSAHVGELANRLPERPVNELTPSFENILIKDFIIENATHFVKVIGIPESPLTNLTIENGEVNCTGFITGHDLQKVTFQKLNITAEDSVINLTDAANLLFNDVDFNTSKAPVRLTIQGLKSDSIRVSGCTNLTDTMMVALSE